MDPIQEQGGVNLYGFVRNRPLDLIDLFGLAVGEWNPSQPDSSIIDDFILSRSEFYKIINRGYGRAAPRYVTENLDRGCVGVCNLYTKNYGPGWADFPENSQETSCFLKYQQAKGWQCPDCTTKVVFAVQRYVGAGKNWTREPVPDSDGVIFRGGGSEESPIDHSEGKYNYMPQIPGTDIWVGVNNGAYRIDGDPEDRNEWYPLAKARQAFLFTRKHPIDYDENKPDVATMFCVRCIKKN